MKTDNLVAYTPVGNVTHMQHVHSTSQTLTQTKLNPTNPYNACTQSINKYECTMGQEL